MRPRSPHRRKFVKGVLAGGALLLSPTPLVRASGGGPVLAPVLAVTTGDPGARDFLRGVEEVVPTRRRLVDVSGSQALFREWDGLSPLRVVGLLDDAAFVLFGAGLHDRGGRFLFQSGGAPGPALRGAADLRSHGLKLGLELGRELVRTRARATGVRPSLRRRYDTATALL